MSLQHPLVYTSALRRLARASDGKHSHWALPFLKGQLRADTQGRAAGQGRGLIRF